MSTLLLWAQYEGAKSGPERRAVSTEASIPEVEVSAARYVSDTPLAGLNLQLPSHPPHTFPVAPALFQLSVLGLGQFLL